MDIPDGDLPSALTAPLPLLQLPSSELFISPTYRATPRDVRLPPRGRMVRCCVVGFPFVRIFTGADSTFCFCSYQNDVPLPQRSWRGLLPTTPPPGFTGSLRCICERDGTHQTTSVHELLEQTFSLNYPRQHLHPADISNLLRTSDVRRWEPSSWTDALPPQHLPHCLTAASPPTADDITPTTTGYNIIWLTLVIPLQLRLLDGFAGQTDILISC